MLWAGITASGAEIAAGRCWTSSTRHRGSDHGNGSGAGGHRDPPALHHRRRRTPTTRSCGSGATPASPTSATAPSPSSSSASRCRSDWSLNATNILAQKYFRGTLGTPEREWSLRQVVDRVVDTITAWGMKDGYFVDDDEAGDVQRRAQAPHRHPEGGLQLARCGSTSASQGVPQQASACFILAVDDTMDSILNWYIEEGTIFKGGSGAGINLSRIRSSVRAAEGRRHRVGPGQLHARRRRLGRHHQVGGQDPPRRQDGHPRRRPPRHRGVHLVQGHRGAQGARPARRRLRHGPRRHGQPLASSTRTPTTRCGSPTSSCRPWSTTPTGTCARSRPARSSRRSRPATSCARSPRPTWECADPGMQFDTTINRWHTAANTGRINGSNPCSRVHAPRQLGLQPGAASTC